MSEFVFNNKTVPPPTDGDFVRFSADSGGGHWTSKTLAETKTDLAIPQLLPFGEFATIATNVTNYTTVAFNGSGVSSSGAHRFYFRVAGTLKNLNVWAGISSTTTITFTVYRGVGAADSVATAITATISNPTTFKTSSDTTHSITIAAGDWIELQCVNASSGFNAVACNGSIEFLPTY